MQYRVCEECGAHLDPGERCDCDHEKKEEAAPAEPGTTSGKTPATSVPAQTRIVNSYWGYRRVCG